MYHFLSILILIASVLLIGVVLIQKSKGGGLATGFDSGNQFAGYRRTTLFVEKATWALAIFICLCSIVSVFVAPNLVKEEAQVIAPVATEQSATPIPAEVPATDAQPAAETPAEAK